MCALIERELGVGLPKVAGAGDGKNILLRGESRHEIVDAWNFERVSVAAKEATVGFTNKCAKLRILGILLRNAGASENQAASCEKTE